MKSTLIKVVMVLAIGGLHIMEYHQGLQSYQQDRQQTHYGPAF